MKTQISIIIVILLCSRVQSQGQSESGESQPASQYHKYLWGTYRPDLLYEYNTMGNEGLAFGIIYHSNKGLDLSNIERCPTLNNQYNKGKGGNSGQNVGYNQKAKHNGGKIDKCKSIPSEYEKQLRYELDQNNHQLKAEYKLHDGTSYLQELIEETNEILMNIKTLKTSYSSLDDQSWSTFINTQRSLPKKQINVDQEQVYSTQSQQQQQQQQEQQQQQQNEQLTEEETNLNHSIYFYFVCQRDTIQQTSSSTSQSKSFRQIRVVDCFETIKLLTNSDQTNTNLKLQIKVANSGGVFTVEDIKNQKDFAFEYRFVRESQLNFRTNSRAGNMRRILQTDLISFKEVNKKAQQKEGVQEDRSEEEMIKDESQRGNILFIKANVKDISKSIFRISYDSKDREPSPQVELIRLMKTAENVFLQNIQQRILTSYKEVPKPIVQISSHALSSILGNIFYIADTSFYTQLTHKSNQTNSQSYSSTVYPSQQSQSPFFMHSTQQSQQNQQQPVINNEKSFYAQKEILGICQARVGGNLTPSLYNDGYILTVIIEWDQQLAEMILSNWMVHRDVEGLSYLDNQNTLQMISTSFSAVHMRQLSQSAPSIIFPIKKLFNKYIDRVKNYNPLADDSIEDQRNTYNYERALELYEYTEDVLFNMLFSSQDNFKHTHKKGNHYKKQQQQQQNQKKENKLEHLKWQIDEFSKMYSSSGVDDLVRHHLTTQELVSSVDYISWAIFLGQSLEKMAAKLSKISPHFSDEKQQYEEANYTLLEMLVEQMYDTNSDKKYFKDKIQPLLPFSKASHQQQPPQIFSPSLTSLNTYPYLFQIFDIEEHDNEDDAQDAKNQDKDEVNLLTKILKTPYGISSSNSTLTFEQIKQQMQVNTNKLSLKGCYESGDISLLQNYLILRRLFADAQKDEQIKKLYRLIYNDLLENILKHYQDFNEIYEVYSKADGKLLRKCRQISAHSVFLLLLNEDYN